MTNDHDGGHHHHGLKHYHDEDMQSVAVRLEGDVDPAKFMPWINRVTQEQGLNILRCKGIVAMKGDPKRFVFQGVHMMLDGDSQREWRPDEKREFEGRVHRPGSHGRGYPQRIPGLRGLTALSPSPRPSPRGRGGASLLPWAEGGRRSRPDEGNYDRI